MDPGRRKLIHDALARLADGDRSAMGPLVAELWPVILAFAERGLPGSADAEDVAQEVFLKICSRISDFERERDGVSWAFAIASYEIMTVRRRRQRRRETASVFDPAVELRAHDAPSQEEVAILAELNALVLAAAGTLSERDRRLLGLVEGAGDGASQATLRKRKQRALDRLRAVWRRFHGEP